MATIQMEKETEMMSVTSTVRWLGLLVVGCGLAAPSEGGARRAKTKPVTARFLSKHVESELLKEGISFARAGQALSITDGEDGGYRVQIRQKATGALLNDRFVTSLPKTRSAAVAEMVVIVSAMFKQAGATSSVDWASTFAGKALSTYLTHSQLRIVLVAPEPVSDELRAAHNALAAGLRAANTQLVLDSDSLGATAGLDDAGIVAKAGDLPVDQVHILRVFVIPNQAPTYVVSMYDRDGNVVGGLSGTGGEALASQIDRADGSGVSHQAADAVALVTQDLKPDKAAEKQFEERAVWFAEYAGINRYGAVVAEWIVPKKGKYGEDLSGSDFYEYVGREDLVSSYNTRLAIRWGTLIGGAAIATAGMLKYVSVETNCLTSDSDCEEGSRTPWLVTGIVGLVVMNVSWFVPLQPISPSEARRLGDEYNAKLRQELGLPELANNDATPMLHEEPPTQIGMSPWLTEGGGGLVMGMTF